MNMKTETFVSVQEYLKTSYEPDCDYVDGEVQERNVGERDHSILQREVIFFFRQRQQLWKAFVFPEQRIQIRAKRFRVPDVCVYVDAEPTEPIFRTPPFICIEILSPEDRMERIQQRIDDYLNFGVQHVWVINPRERRAWTYSKDGSREVFDGLLTTQNPDFEIPLAEIFAALDTK
jgi:Uma2 family endonuclease